MDVLFSVASAAARAMEAEVRSVEQRVCDVTTATWRVRARA